MENNTDFLVSALCRTFNQSNYITDTLDGFAMQQTTFPFVAVVIDDASTDGEQGVIRSYVERYFDCSPKSVFRQWETEDAHWTFARHLENENCYFVVVYLKRNLHQEKEKKEALVKDWTNTKYVALCEGDDYWTDPLKLQKQVGFMETHEDCTMCCTGFSQTFEGDEREKSAVVYDMDEITFDRIIKGIWIGTLTVVYRREVMDDYQPPISDLPFGDLPFWCQLALIGRIKYFRDVTANYRCLKESASHSEDLKKQLKFDFDSMRAREYYATISNKVDVVRSGFSKDSHYYLEQCYKNCWFDFPMDTLWHFVKEYGHPSGYDKVKYWGMKSKHRYNISKLILSILKKSEK